MIKIQVPYLNMRWCSINDWPPRSKKFKGTCIQFYTCVPFALDGWDCVFCAGVYISNCKMQIWNQIAPHPTEHSDRYSWNTSNFIHMCLSLLIIHFVLFYFVLWYLYKSKQKCEVELMLMSVQVWAFSISGHATVVFSALQYVSYHIEERNVHRAPAYHLTTLCGFVFFFFISCHFFPFIKLYLILIL